MKRRSTGLRFYFALFAFQLAGLRVSWSAVPVFPGSSWAHDPNVLPAKTQAEMSAFLPTLETTGFLVVIGGKIAYEYGDISEVSYIASVRKSVLSMLFGLCSESDSIRLDSTLESLDITDVGGLLPVERTATVYDLISARSGIYHPASNSGDLLEYAPARGSKRPGSYWLYNNWDFNAAGLAFERMTGRNIYDAIFEEFAGPIGMQDFDRAQQCKDENPDVSQIPAYTMWMSTRDMARLGLLMLRDGEWAGNQIIDADWIKRSTSTITHRLELNPEFMRFEPFGYGAMWWVWDEPEEDSPYFGGYTAAGAHGQWITVLPNQDLVIAHKTFWSSSGGPKYNVKRNDYYRLLDLLTGCRPATQEELFLWHSKAEVK